MPFLHGVPTMYGEWVMLFTLRNPLDIISLEPFFEAFPKKKFSAIHVVFYGVPSMPVVRINVHAKVKRRSPFCFIVNQVNGVECHRIFFLQQMKRGIYKRLPVSNKEYA